MGQKTVLRRYNRKYVTAIIILIILWILTMLSAFSSNDKRFGTAVIFENEIKEKFNGISEEGEAKIYVDGHEAPYIKKEKLYLVTESEDENWTSVLTAENGKRVFALDDEYIAKKKEAISECHRFTIYVGEVGGVAEKRYIEFTMLPVVMMAVDEEDAKNELAEAGRVSVYDKKFAGKSFQYQESEAEWNVRGNSSYGYPKKQYKLNLYKNGEPNHLNFLGIRSDDDWILDGFYADPTKMRAKLVEDVWTQISSTEGSDMQIQNMEYVEVVLDGEYAGLYGLRSRIDNHSYAYSPDDILFAIEFYWEISEENWKNLETSQLNVGPFFLDYYPISANSAWEVIKEFSRQFCQQDTVPDFEKAIELVDMENQIDNELMCNALEMCDNVLQNNVYYIYKSKERKFYRLVWDFDSMLRDQKEILVTFEMSRLMDAANDKQKEEMNELLSERWKELRKNIFDDENISGRLRLYEKELKESGALQRETKRLDGDIYAGSDEWGRLGWVDVWGVDTLMEIISYRLKMLDDYYQ